MYGTNIFGIGMPELFFIAILALIVLGPKRLPGVIREVGKVIRQIRSLTNELTSQFSEELALLDEINPQRILKELIDETDDKKKPKTTNSTNKTVTKPVTKRAKPALGSKPALGETDTQASVTDDSSDTTVEDNALKDEDGRVEEADTVAAQNEQPAENRIAPPSMGGSAQTLRDENSANTLSKPVNTDIVSETAAFETANESAPDADLDDAPAQQEQQLS